MNIKPEILAPAGDRERLEAAVRFGADAVYLGGERFGMRASPANFNRESLPGAVEYAHAHGVKVYLTCNTLPRNQELSELPEFLINARRAGVDALILSDIGVLMQAKQIVPELEIHISTQAGIVNYASANAFYELGARRVVLARELSLAEIKEIRDNTPPDLEIEAFVHGAMCMSFSGRCLLSNYIVGRDANRGECAQPCRWGYHLMEEKRPGQFFPVYEDEKGSYILNAKDLCMIEHIDDLCKAGITSFKIEGRAKSSYYVSVVVNAYRCAVDHFLRSEGEFVLPSWIREEVDKVSHRRYCTGFFYGPIDNGQYYENGGYERRYDVAAVVTSYRDGRLVCSQRNKIEKGDVLEVLEPGKPPFSLTAQALYDEAGQPIENTCHAQMTFELESAREAVPGAIIRKEKEQGSQR